MKLSGFSCSPLILLSQKEDFTTHFGLRILKKELFFFFNAHSIFNVINEVFLEKFNKHSHNYLVHQIILFI